MGNGTWTNSSNIFPMHNYASDDPNEQGKSFRGGGGSGGSGGGGSMDRIVRLESDVANLDKSIDRVFGEVRDLRNLGAGLLVTILLAGVGGSITIYDKMADISFAVEGMANENINQAQSIEYRISAFETRLDSQSSMLENIEAALAEKFARK